MTQESSQKDPSSDDGALGVSDDELPEDLRPGDDNPLAQPADDDVPDDLLAEESGHARTGDGSEDASPTGDDGAAEAPSSEASSEAGDGADDGSGDGDD